MATLAFDGELTLRMAKKESTNVYSSKANPKLKVWKTSYRYFFRDAKDHEYVWTTDNGTLLERKGNGDLMAKATSSPMTGDEMAAQIKAALEPIYGHLKFRVIYERNRLDSSGKMGTFWIRFANVKKGASDLDTLNANHQAWIMIKAAGEPEYGKITLWPYGTPAPEKVKASDEHHRGFRAKTASPQAIVDYVVKFFMDNRADFLVPYDPDHWRRK